MPDDKPTPEEACAALHEQMVADGFSGTFIPARLYSGLDRA